MKKLLFILCLFPFLMQAQDKEEAIMVLPDLLVKGEVVNGQQTNTLIVTNYLNGSLLKKSFEWILYDLHHLKGHVRGCFFIEFVISKKGKIAISYIEGFDKYTIKESIEFIFDTLLENTSPARNKKGDPIATKGFLLIHYDVQTLFPEDFEEIRILP